MITLTIQDSSDSMTFEANMIVPIVLNPIINDTDVETIDGNISTYYSSTKRQYEIQLIPMDQGNYAKLKEFVVRQYESLRYPQITIEGAQVLDVDNLTAKISLSPTEVINSCGLVDGIKLTFRESKQLV